MQPVSGINPDPEMYEGLCVGGPLDGKLAYSRFPKGLLVCDREKERAWIYEWSGEVFNVRDTEGVVLVNDEDAPDNRWRAALEGDYDVIAWSEDE